MMIFRNVDAFRLCVINEKKSFKEIEKRIEETESELCIPFAASFFFFFCFQNNNELLSWTSLNANINPRKHLISIEWNELKKMYVKCSMIKYRA